MGVIKVIEKQPVQNGVFAHANFILKFYVDMCYFMMLDMVSVCECKHI